MTIRTWGAWWLTMVLGCLGILIWVWVNTYRYIFSGMNIYLPAILGFTRGTRVLTHCHILNTIHMASEIYQTWGNWWHHMRWNGIGNWDDSTLAALALGKACFFLEKTQYLLVNIGKIIWFIIYRYWFFLGRALELEVFQWRFLTRFRWWQQDSLDMHRIWKGLLVEEHSRESGEERSGETCSDWVLPMVGLGFPLM